MVTIKRPPGYVPPPAKVIKIKNVTAWSFSRYNEYRKCPALTKYKVIERRKEPGNQAMERGNLIHKLAEDYIKGNIAKLPPELLQFKAEFAKLRKMYKAPVKKIAVEDSWSFTKDWAKTTWDDWDHCWVRIKLDCAHQEADDVLIVTDWKTGKYREESNEDYIEQLELYALAAFLWYDTVQTVKPRLAYLDLGMIYPEKPDDIAKLTFTRADLPRLKKTWEKRTKPMMVDVTFAPRPSSACRWCHFSAAKSGPCAY